MTNTVKFDPGIGELVLDFNNYINDVYSKLMNLYSPHQKRAHFKLYESKILNYIQNNIAFYMGCLLWAYYISNSDTPAKIEGNPFLNMTDEQKEEYDFALQVNFMENYFDSFERDTAYYTGKKTSIPDQWKKILSLYSEFLELNKGFVNTKITSDIKIPANIKNLNLVQIKNLIDKVLKEKDLTLFLNNKNIAI